MRAKGSVVRPRATCAASVAPSAAVDCTASASLPSECSDNFEGLPHAATATASRPRRSVRRERRSLRALAKQTEHSADDFTLDGFTLARRKEIRERGAAAVPARRRLPLPRRLLDGLRLALLHPRGQELTGTLAIDL